MIMPDYQSIMLPLLKYANDSQEHSLREVIEALAEDEFNFSNGHGHRNEFRCIDFHLYTRLIFLFQLQIGI